MVVRGYPEEAIRRREIATIPEIAEPKEAIESKEVVRYVYLQPERIQLDPNTALITLGVIAAVGMIALAIIYKK